MSRWIDADEVAKLMKCGCAYAIWDLPSIDIVRCGECKHCMGGKYCYRVLSGDAELYKRAIIFPVEANDFCSYGERRE